MLQPQLPDDTPFLAPQASFQSVPDNTYSSWNATVAAVVAAVVVVVAVARTVPPTDDEERPRCETWKALAVADDDCCDGDGAATDDEA